MKPKNRVTASAPRHWLGALPAALALLLAACGEAGAGGALSLGEERVEQDEAAIAARMIELSERIMAREEQGGLRPRLNQAKSLGCLQAGFRIADNLPAELRQGLFARAANYQATLRFANASRPDDRDSDLRGLSIKVHGVEGTPLWGNAGEQDFLLNSHPVLFAAQPAEFLALVEAQAEAALWKFFIDPRNLDSVWILLRGRQRIASPFDISYWSTTPYRFGAEGSAVKYAVRSCSAQHSERPEDPGPDFLRAAMREHLAAGEACFDFLVQVQTDAEAMPIEDASRRWDEDASPFRRVASILVTDQDFSSPAALQACEALRFNPWQALPEHRPLGGINRVREAVYAAAGDFRAGGAPQPGAGP